MSEINKLRAELKNLTAELALVRQDRINLQANARLLKARLVMTQSVGNNLRRLCIPGMNWTDEPARAALADWDAVAGNREEQE